MRHGAWMLVVAAGMASMAGGALGEASLRLVPVAPEEPLRPVEIERADHVPASVSLARTIGDADAVSDKPTYGDEGGRFWAIGGGITHDFVDATDTNIFFSYHYFLADGVEFVGEVGAWYYNQPGDDAVALNPAMVFRWHFLRREDWTLFADMGIGLLFASDNVPDGGTSFDFTPRIGVGMTYAFDEDTRLLMGLRWAHVSNARILGNDQNPSRDGPMLYAGVIFRF